MNMIHRTQMFPQIKLEGKARPQERVLLCSVQPSLLVEDRPQEEIRQVRGCFLLGGRHGSASWRGLVDGAGYDT
jgi:hypothetical protein